MYDKRVTTSVSLQDYMKHSGKAVVSTSTEQVSKDNEYDFESGQEYYANRKEFDIVGIIDKEPNKKKLKTFDELEDIFKIRERKKAYSGKKRGTGIQTLTGTVCYNSQHRETLEKILKKLGIKPSSSSRVSMCLDIRNALMELEKYGTDRDGNKMTYVIIPTNHKTLPFPYNLEDRKDYIINKINEEIKKNLSITVDTKVEDKKHYYLINIKASKDGDYDNVMKKYNAELVGDKYVITVK
jgi:hypothetical protein